MLTTTHLLLRTHTGRLPQFAFTRQVQTGAIDTSDVLSYIPPNTPSTSIFLMLSLWYIPSNTLFELATDVITVDCSRNQVPVICRVTVQT